MTADQLDALQSKAPHSYLSSFSPLQVFQQHQNLIWQYQNDAVLICDDALHVLAVNPAFQRITGFCADEVVGQNVELWRSGLMNKRFYRQVAQTLEKNTIWQGEIWNRRKDGSVFPAFLTVCKQTVSPAVGCFVAIFRDLTAQKEAESHAHNHTRYDMLTDLPNRLLFAQSLTRFCSSEAPFALMVLDLNDMKTINTTMDHFTGDEVLCAVAHRLSGRLRGNDMLARIGGDEFALLVPGIVNRRQAEIYAKQVMGCFDWPFQLENQQLYISAAMGVTLWPADSKEPDLLLSNAEQALFEAKKLHVPLRLYNGELRRNLQSRNRLQQDLANAIKYHQLSLVYQPIWDITHQRVVKLEALVRWNHPERGAISPGEFIPLAEESGLIQGLGQWILLHACADLVRLRKLGFAELQMSINRSTPEFQTIDLDAKEWLTTIIDMGLDPKSIIFEITESLLMSNQESNRQRMRALRDAGCRIAIDDFGTGYSALSYLRSFPIDVVKIDRAFVRSIPEEKQECLLLDGIIDLVNSLGMSLIIEGVETRDQLAYLQARQCAFIQGYLFSKPLAFDDLVTYLQRVSTHPV